MLETLYKHKTFFLILLSWVVLGRLGGGIVGTVVTCGSLLYFWNKGMFSEALIGLFFILTLSDSSLFSFAATAKTLYMPLLCILMILNNFHLMVKVDAFYKRLGVFLIYSLTLLFLSETFFTSIQKNISYILLIVCIPPLLVGIYQESKRNSDEFFSILFTLGFIVLFLGVLLLLSGSEEAFRGRFRGILGNPNGLGLYCMLLFFLYMTAMEYKLAVFSRGSNILFFSVFVISLILCGSRASIIGVLVGVFIYYFKLGWVSAFFFVAFAIIGSTVLYDLALSGIETLSLEGYLRLDTLDMAGGRVHGWAFAWEQIQENFIFGKGWSYDEYIFRINFDELEMLNHQGGVHNSFLGVWLNTGFLGLILFCLGWFSIFFQASFNSRWAIPLIFSVLITANFEPWLIASLNPFTIQLLFCITLQWYKADFRRINRI